MIDINATLLLQAIHFGVAYFLLKYLLFDPALTYIYAQEKAMSDAVSRLQLFKRTMEQKEKEKEALWLQAQAFFARNAPASVPEQAIHTREHELSAPQISSEQRADATKTLEEVFVKSWETDGI